METQEQLITVKNKNYRLADLNPDQIELLQSLVLAEQKIASHRREIAIFQAGRDTMLNTLELLLKNVTPVDPESVE